MKFEVLYRDDRSLARVGLLQTRRGDIETPVFMPVGTAGAVVKPTNQAETESTAQIAQKIYQTLLS